MQFIRSSNFFNLLPKSFKTVETECIAYAISQEITKLCYKADIAGVLYSIKSLNEDLLDYLAVEFRSQYYSQDMSVYEKTQIIENTLLWYITSGTVGAIRNLLSLIYGDVSISEWFNYGGAPFYFKVGLNNPKDEFNEKQFNQLLFLIDSGKNARSILDGVNISVQVSNAQSPYIGYALQQNILKCGAGCDFMLFLGCTSFNEEALSEINSGTFDNPTDEILDCGYF